MMLKDEETMSFNHAWGGTISFPKEDWLDWHSYWVINNKNKRYYRYLLDEENIFIGEIAYHFNEEYQGYVANVLIYAKYRNKGYGTKALNLLCEAAKENGIKFLLDDIAIDNPGINIFLKLDLKKFLVMKR